MFMNGDLLSIDDEEALLAAPAVGLLGLAPLVVLASELAHFVVHDELHQLQACLAHQLADALLQGGGDFFERQVQLQFLPGFFGLLVELANGLFAVNLVSFLHSDSPFSKMKNITPSLTARTGESLLSTNYRTSSPLRER